MSIVQSANFSNIGAGSTAQFELGGGKYGLAVSATFGGGNVQLQMLSMDGSTWINVGSSVTAAGLSTFDLPRGQYRLTVTTSTAVYAALAYIPCRD